MARIKRNQPRRTGETVTHGYLPVAAARNMQSMVINNILPGAVTENHLPGHRCVRTIGCVDVFAPLNS